MRTGFWLPEQGADPTIEVKFNPYHDPANGQFTFGPGGAAGSAGMTRPPRVPQQKKNDGSWRGGFNGGGGGTGGGGGATGTYRSPDPTPAKPVAHQKLVAKPLLKRAAPAVTVHGASPGPSTHVEKNGYVFALDASHRTHQAMGELSLAPTAPRSKDNQRQAGGTDRRNTDDGGHFIAARFNGPSDAFNLFAQNANFNRGRYRALEDEWAKDLHAGKHVSVVISASYTGGSKRPHSVGVRWTTDGHSQFKIFLNESDRK